MNLIDRSIRVDLDVHAIPDDSTTEDPGRPSLASALPALLHALHPDLQSGPALFERWVAELTERWLRRGSHRFTKELIASIHTWTTDRPHLSVWRRAADGILQMTLAMPSWLHVDRFSD